MAEFLRADAVVYIDGVETSGNLNVGYISGADWVIKFPFTVGNSGASEFSFLLTAAYLNYSINGIGDAGNFAFAIAPRDGKSYADHNGADTGDTGDGTLTFEAVGSGLYNISGSVKKPILPGDYYLWLFPNFNGPSSSSFRLWYGVNFSAAYELSGAAGLVRIKEDDQELLTIPMVNAGGQLVTLAATVKQGNALVFCV